MSDISKMSDAEMRRRQKLQGKIGRTTSTLGLAGVGLAGTGALLAHKPGALKKLPKLKNAEPEKLKNAAFHTGIISGGIGGVGGFNQASIYSAEAKRRKTAVAKSMGIEPPYSGDISKEWAPSASKYDPETKRNKRSQNYQSGLEVGAGAGAGGAASHAVRGIRTEAKNWTKGQRRAKKLPTVAAKQAGRRIEALGHGRKAGAWAAGGTALAGGAALVHRQRKGSWQSYQKRDSVSAFGVDHGDEVAKAINIKPENKGKFTALAHKKGKGVQEAAHSVVNSDKSTELQRKRAQFAINAKKWHHSKKS